MSEGPLHGVRILDFTWVLAGPYCTRILADLGAEVIKVQSTATARGATDENRTGYFNTYNRNKLGVHINMRTEEGKDLARKVARISDAVLDNFSSRVVRQWEMDYDSLVKIKPDIICCSISGMGASGRWKDFVSFGPTAQALTGFALLTAFPDEHPAGFGYSYSDHMAGTVAATAVLAALEYKARTGRGQYIDTSQLEATAPLVGPALLDYTANGVSQGAIGNRSLYASWAPHGAFPCRGDDRWITIAVRNDDEWSALVGLMGQPEWASERFDSTESRLASQDELEARLAEWTSGQEAEALRETLCQAGIPAGVVHNAEDLLNDRQLGSREFYVQAEHPELGTVRFDGFPATFSGPGFEVRRPAPLLGEHNDYVFKELLGLTDSQLSDLAQAGVFD
ncbi:MAG TPA: CoA transferase [Dehalococcoidia bacterium]|nr:CoA transferase [Dehalococcoidia bacterium]